MTIETSRKPDYYSDIDTYGKFGEELFLKEYSHLFIRDVRSDPDYQKTDVDFLVNGRHRVEVKVDTVALKSGNIAYEMVSHGSSGWSVSTQADYVYMVLAKDNPLTPVWAIMIDMKRWHDFCADRKTPKKMNVIQSESIVDILCKINDLRKYGVIIREKRFEIRD